MKQTRAAVLAVDDSSDDTLMLRNACQRARASFDLFTVEDGVEAIEYLTGVGPFQDRIRNPIPALMLLDLKMPRKNGFEVLEWLRTRAELKSLPVAVLTSSDHQSDVREAYNKGAKCYLMKPLDFDELTELVSTISNGIHDNEQLWKNLADLQFYRACI